MPELPGDYLPVMVATRGACRAVGAFSSILFPILVSQNLTDQSNPTVPSDHFNFLSSPVFRITSEAPEFLTGFLFCYSAIERSRTTEAAYSLCLHQTAQGQNHRLTALLSLHALRTPGLRKR